MFHGISERLSRLARRTHDVVAISFDQAGQLNLEARRVRPGTWEFRDPRFGQLAARRHPTGRDSARGWSR